jgi:hypothetical protein
MDLCLQIKHEAVQIDVAHEDGVGADLSFPAAAVRVLAARLKGADFCQVTEVVLSARIPILKLKQVRVCPPPPPHLLPRLSLIPKFKQVRSRSFVGASLARGMVEEHVWCFSQHASITIIPLGLLPTSTGC